MKGSLSGSLASLGAATPYALAAKMAYPERPVIGTIGDGAMQMNGMNVMITVSKYWKEWSNPVFIMMVLNNRDLSQVTCEGLGLLENWLGCTLPESQQEGGLSVGAVGPQGASRWRDYPPRSVRARSFAP
jgi:hypothetical protein